MAFLDNQGVSKLCALLKDKFDSLWTAVNGKQGALTAGSNITISDGVISATDTTYTAGTGINISNGEISCTVTDTDTTYTAGTGISISNGEISCTVSGGEEKHILAMPNFVFSKQHANNFTGGAQVYNNFTILAAGVYGGGRTDDTSIANLKAGYAIESTYYAFTFQNDQLIDLIGEPTGVGVTAKGWVYKYDLNGQYQMWNRVRSAISGETDVSIQVNANYIVFLWRGNMFIINEVYWDAAIQSLFGYTTPASLPAAPSVDGNYLLKCSVSSGTPTYTWESVTVGGSY